MMDLLLFVIMCLACCENIFAYDGKYTTKYDNIDFEEIIASDRLLKNYINCLMDRGSCSPDARELKRVLPDALETDCKKCSEAQKSGIFRIIKHLAENRKSWWDELAARYDPDGVYREKYKDEWQLRGILLR